MTDTSYKPLPPAVVIVSDQALQKKYNTMLTTSFIFQWHGSYFRLEDAWLQVRRLQAPLVLICASACAPDPAAACRLIRQANSSARILFVGFVCPEIPQVVAAGVAGYLTPEATVLEMQDALFQISVGELALSPAISKFLVNTVSACDNHNLTPAEVRTLHEWKDCKSKNEVAADLGVSLGTVSRQLYTIYRKLGITTRQEAIARAHQIGKPQSFVIGVTKTKPIL